MVNQLPPGNPPGVPTPAPFDPNAVAVQAADYLPARLAGEPTGGTNWRRYVTALVRHKWLVIGLTLLGLAAGMFATRFLKPTYVSNATIWIDEPTDSRRGAGRNADQGPIRIEQIFASDGWVDLFKRWVVLDAAVGELQLYLSRAPGDSLLFASFRLKDQFRPGDYRLTVDDSGKGMVLATKQGTTLERAAVGDSIGGAVGFVWLPPSTEMRPRRIVSFTVTTPREAAQALARRLKVEADRNGSFIRVEMSGNSPTRVATVLSTVVNRYVQVAGELKRQKITELKAILDEQLGRASSNLRNAELSLENFRVHTITLPSEPASPLAAGLEATKDPVYDNFFSMKIDQESLRRDREAVQRALTMSDSTGLTDALEVIGAVQSSTALSAALDELTDREARLRALRYKYTDDYPPLKRLAEEIETLRNRSIPALARSLISELKARENDLSQRIDLASRELRQIPPRTIQEARLGRDVDIAEELYTTLQGRFEEARLAEASSLPDVRVLDHPVIPERPSKNRRPQVLLIGLLAGLGLGILGALLLDRLDRRVRYPEQVTTEMGLPILGVVPYMKQSRNGLRSQEVAPVIEALRGIKLNLVHAHGAAGPLMVMITSPGSGDGKSFVASNLALAFADAGHRTLLIDGDVRRGALHRVLNAQRKPGLTDLLSGKAPREEVVQATGYASLEFIGCGTRLSGAPELLGSPAMSQLVSTLRSQYGVILVDSPPLGAGVDAFALGTITGNTMIVLRTGTTDRELAEAKLDVLDRLPIRVLGAVLNGVREDSVYRYYSYYLPGYEYEDDEEGKEIKVLNRAV